ncbi:MAG: AAA family ATPase [Deltaproteobacteria bacterium]|nr:AAA family ATPase [Deltaproteobacteria bacterium]
MTSLKLARLGPFEAPVHDYVRNLLIGTELPQLIRDKQPPHGSVDVILSAVGGDPSKPKHRLSLGRRIERFLEGQPEAKQPAAPDSPVLENLLTLSQALGLESEARAMLQWVAAFHADRRLARLLQTFGDLQLSDTLRVISSGLASSTTSTRRALSELVKAGLIRHYERSTSIDFAIHLDSRLLDALLVANLDHGQLVESFLPSADPPTLEASDYADHSEPLGLARELLRATIRERRAGTNLLLHGPTGTGKTQLARLLAKEVGCPLFIAGGADEDGESPGPWERLSSLLLGQRLIGTEGILLFDELEDLFEDDRPVMSKLWFNRILESNVTPTIWITNEVSDIDRAFLRRFTFAIELPESSARRRARALVRHLGEDHDLSPRDIERLSTDYRASPAQIASAVSASRLVGSRPTVGTIERILGPIEKLIHGAEVASARVESKSPYRVDVLNASEDVSALADALERYSAGRGTGISLCIHGPPGTGKSELARYFASRMHRRVVERRASDLVSKWVGETESNIARAFREAEDDGVMLLFDEADSFLRDRRNAVRSFEVTAVNELLQQIEHFKGVVAFTTNLWKEIDPAALRRFVFKVELRYSLPTQAVELFRSSFAEVIDAAKGELESSELEAALRGLELGPGDFGAVRRKLVTLGERRSPSELIAQLRAEVEARGTKPRPIGFAQSGSRNTGSPEARDPAETTGTSPRR